MLDSGFRAFFINVFSSSGKISPCDVILIRQLLGRRGWLLVEEVDEGGFWVVEANEGGFWAMELDEGGFWVLGQMMVASGCWGR